MDLETRDGAFSAKVNKIEIDGDEMFHLEILEDGELVFDFNGNLEECVDYLIRIGNR